MLVEATDGQSPEATLNLEPAISTRAIELSELCTMYKGSTIYNAISGLARGRQKFLKIKAG